MTRNRTVWTRLESRPRRDDMQDGLEAAVRDPLWLLSRQWQVSEFRGEDGGSAVRADIEVAEDPLTRVDLRAGGRGDSNPFDYPGDPLEATVEREQITDDPPLRLRAEAGQQFLRMLSERELGDFSVAMFPERLHLTAPDDAFEPADRRYVDIMSGNTLDGTAVARSIRAAINNIDEVVHRDTQISWSGVVESKLPIPAELELSEAVEQCIESYYRWYVGLYDEPTVETGGAWNPERLEYSFAVATGDKTTETVFEATEYAGDRLEWYDFDATGADSLDPPDAGESTTRSEAVMPTGISVPGMPTPQWWEFEEADVDLTDVTDDGAALTQLTVLEFALQFGNDWLKLPVTTSVGTLSRIPELRVTDSFGIEEAATPAFEDDWQLFAHELPGHDEPGLLVLPTAGEVREGEPVERVVFARDNTANLVFALEEYVEGPTGRALDQTEFEQPSVVVDTVSADMDPDAEYLRLANPGDDRYVLENYTIEARYPDHPTETICTIEHVLGAGETVDIFTGQAGDTDAIGCGRSSSAWTDADTVDIRGSDDRLVHRTLLARPTEARADYRLSTSIPAYWFPFVPVRATEQEPAGGPGDPVAAESDEFRLERALVLDADSLGLPLTEIPRPVGEILTPDPESLPEDAQTYRIMDEEITMSGREVTRRYRFARGTDGRGYLWSGRQSHIGDTQLESGLQFDILEDRDS